MNKHDEAERIRPGSRRFHEVRGEELFEIMEIAYDAEMLLISEFFRASKVARNEGLPAPPAPQIDAPHARPGNDKPVVCVERIERKLDPRFFTRSGMRLAPEQVGGPLSFAAESATGGDQ